MRYLLKHIDFGIKEIYETNSPGCNQQQDYSHHFRAKMSIFSWAWCNYFLFECGAIRHVCGILGRQSLVVTADGPEMS